jgi:hypothetical protein
MQMKAIHMGRKRGHGPGARLDRRTVLRGAGMMLALPALDAMATDRAQAATKVPRRILAICNNLGVLPQHFFPADAGRGYTLSPYLQNLASHREHFTVMSGVSHPDVDGGHPADICFLTSAPHPGRGGFRNTISLDQYAAEHIGHLTRFPTLSLGVNVQQGSRGLSWTAAGVLIPSEEKPSDVFKRLFMNGTREEIEAQERSLDLGHSILDAVADQAAGLQAGLGARDRERIDQYFTSVRDLEKRMTMQKAWQARPKPHVKAAPPTDAASPREFFEKVRLMYRMSRLAFETDSTRLVTLMLDGVSTPAPHIEGVTFTDGYHNLSHHGKSSAKQDQLKIIDEMHMKVLGELLTDLGSSTEDGASLLDRTMVLYGTNLGNADAHTTTNLPTLLAGGGFRHGQHLAFSKEHNYPLPNLFVSMLQRMGIETSRFGTGTAPMAGLQMV